MDGHSNTIFLAIGITMVVVKGVKESEDCVSEKVKSVSSHGLDGPQGAYLIMTPLSRGVSVL
jgi:hypothetical protein